MKYCPKTEHCQSPPTAPEGEASEPSGFQTFATSVRGWEQMILSTLLGNRAMVIDDDDGDDSDN